MTGPNDELNPVTFPELPVAVHEKDDPIGVDCSMIFVVPSEQTEEEPAFEITGSGLAVIDSRVGEGAVHPLPAL